MRGVTRGVVVVCLLLGAVSMDAAPGEWESRGGGVVRKAVKRIIRALGDGLTIPGSSPAPAPRPAPKP
jgi:hypothetical protein